MEECISLLIKKPTPLPSNPASILRSGGSWLSYWEKQSEVLFFGEKSKTIAGRLYNQVKGSSDYLIVTGPDGFETYQCPNTDEYKNADTDFIWFKKNGTRRTVSRAELIGYDLQKTPVKYLDNNPNAIQIIMILKSGLSTEKMNKLHMDFRLPIMWDGFWRDQGYTKENRPIYEQYLWNGALATIAISSKTIGQATPTKINITFAEALDETSVPAAAAFVVSGRVVSAVEIAGAVLTLTVTAGFDYGNTATVGYTLTTQSPLKTAAGDRVNTFAAEAVTNNIVTPVFLADTYTWARYKANEAATITQTSNRVTRWNDFLGSGHDLIVMTGSGEKRPLLTAEGVYSDGFYNALQTAAAALNQPTTIYLVLKMKAWNNIWGNCKWFDGQPARNLAYIVEPSAAGTPYIGAAAGLVSSYSNAVALNTLVVVTVKFAGANSWYRINNGAKITGNFGTSNMGGFTLFGDNSGAGYNSSLAVRDVVIRTKADVDADDTRLLNYLKTLYTVY